MERIICLAIGYVCGLLQSGYLVGKLHHIDIRKSGSGNAGSTNALRVMGWKAGLMTFAGDVLKCFAAVLIVRGLYHGSNCLALLMMYAGAGVTLGHNFPFYMKFKGGKGIATTGGVIFAFHWQLGLVCAAVFLIITIISKYVSLGSICMVLIIPFILYFNNPQDWKLVVVGCIFTAMAIWRHRANIGRLMNGTENKLGQKVKR